MEKLQEILEEMELKNIVYLDEIMSVQNNFLIDTNPAREKNKELSIYPLTKKKNLTHDLLNLYGTHWKYIINYKDEKNWTCTKKDGDLELVLKRIRNGDRQRRNAVYAFTQKYLDKFKSLWLFVPDTKGWEYSENILMPINKADMKKYKTQKQLM